MAKKKTKVILTPMQEFKKELRKQLNPLITLLKKTWDWMCTSEVVLRKILKIVLSSIGKAVFNFHTMHWLWLVGSVIYFIGGSNVMALMYLILVNLNLALMKLIEKMGNDKLFTVAIHTIMLRLSALEMPVKKKAANKAKK